MRFKPGGSPSCFTEDGPGKKLQNSEKLVLYYQGKYDLADVKGDIGWQAVGIAPIRKLSGLVPVLEMENMNVDIYLLLKNQIFNPKKVSLQQQIKTLPFRL